MTTIMPVSTHAPGTITSPVATVPPNLHRAMFTIDTNPPGIALPTGTSLIFGWKFSTDGGTTCFYESDATIQGGVTPPTTFHVNAPIPQNPYPTSAQGSFDVVGGAITFGLSVTLS